MKLNKIRELEIAKIPFDITQKCLETIDYKKWIDFVEDNNFVWKENTEEGKTTIQNLSLIPESFRERVLLSLNKRTACFDFNEKKRQYRILVTFRSDFNYIEINVEEKLSVFDLEFFLKMAKHLDALLLKDGKEMVNEKLIKDLKIFSSINI